MHRNAYGWLVYNCSGLIRVPGRGGARAGTVAGPVRALLRGPCGHCCGPTPTTYVRTYPLLLFAYSFSLILLSWPLQTAKSSQTCDSAEANSKLTHPRLFPARLPNLLSLSWPLQTAISFPARPHSANAQTLFHTCEPSKLHSLVWPMLSGLNQAEAMQRPWL